MLIRFFYIIFGFVLCQNLHAAGPAFFNYETLEHVGPAAGTNRALVHYDYALITARNAAIPVLAPGAFQIGISNIRLLAMPTVWQHVVFPIVGGGLNLQEACLMAIEREGIGVTVDFQYRWVLNAIVAGFPLAAVGAAFPGGQAAMMRYLRRAWGWISASSFSHVFIQIATQYISQFCRLSYGWCCRYGPSSYS